MVMQTSRWLWQWRYTNNSYNNDDQKKNDDDDDDAAANAAAAADDDDGDTTVSCLGAVVFYLPTCNVFIFLN